MLLLPPPNRAESVSYKHIRTCRNFTSFPILWVCIITANIDIPCGGKLFFVQSSVQWPSDITFCCSGGIIWRQLGSIPFVFSSNVFQGLYILFFKCHRCSILCSDSSHIHHGIENPHIRVIHRICGCCWETVVRQVHEKKEEKLELFH